MLTSSLWRHRVHWYGAIADGFGYRPSSPRLPMTICVGFIAVVPLVQSVSCLSHCPFHKILVFFVCKCLSVKASMSTLTAVADHGVWLLCNQVSLRALRKSVTQI